MLATRWLFGGLGVTFSASRAVSFSNTRTLARALAGLGGGAMVEVTRSRGWNVGVVVLVKMKGNNAAFKRDAHRQFESLDPHWHYIDK